MDTCTLLCSEEYSYNTLDSKEDQEMQLQLGALNVLPSENQALKYKEVYVSQVSSSSNHQKISTNFNSGENLEVQDNELINNQNPLDQIFNNEAGVDFHQKDEGTEEENVDMGKKKEKKIIFSIVKQKKNLIFLASIVQSEILFNDASKNVPFSREIAKYQFFHKILQREPILKKFQVVRNEYIIGTINAKLNTGKILSDCMMKNLPNKGFNSKTDFKFVRATLDMTLKEIFLYAWTKYLKKELTISDKKKQANNLEVLANILKSDNDTLKDFMSSTLEEVTKEYLNSKSFSKDKETLVKEQMENCVSWKGKCSGHCYNFKKAYEIFIIGESKQNSGYLEYFKGHAKIAKVKKGKKSIACLSASTDSSI